MWSYDLRVDHNDLNDMQRYPEGFDYNFKDKKGNLKGGNDSPVSYEDAFMSFINTKLKKAKWPNIVISQESGMQDQKRAYLEASIHNFYKTKKLPTTIQEGIELCKGLSF